MTSQPHPHPAYREHPPPGKPRKINSLSRYDVAGQLNSSRALTWPAGAMGRRHGPGQQGRSHTERQACDELAQAPPKYWGTLSDAPINHSLASRQGTLSFAYESPNARPTLGRLAVRAIAGPGRALRVGGSTFPSRRLEWGPVVGKRCAGSVDAVGQPARQLPRPPGTPPRWAFGARGPIPLGATPDVWRCPIARCRCRCLGGAPSVEVLYVRPRNCQPCRAVWLGSLEWCACSPLPLPPLPRLPGYWHRHTQIFSKDKDSQ